MCKEKKMVMNAKVLIIIASIFLFIYCKTKTEIEIQDKMYSELIDKLQKLRILSSNSILSELSK
jgi:hypothetical protein